MPDSRILLSFVLISVYITSVLSQTCTPRSARQLVQDSSFEEGNLNWSGHDNPVLTVPTYPAHSGTHMNVMSASYIKSPGSAAITTTSYTSQVLSALPGITFDIKAFYNVVSYSKGSSCPDASFPLTTCKLTISYAFQTIKIIDLALTGGYVEFSTPFLAETGGRYIQFDLRCQSATEDYACAEVTVLLDDVTFSDPGNDCSWRFWGCYTDSTSSRSLPNHGTIFGWPATTTIEACCRACEKDGYWYAGLEFGNECWCGNGLGGHLVTDGSCNMPCSGFPQQVCGGPDRLTVYHQGVWTS